MLVYEELSDTLIRVRVEPSTYLQSGTSYSKPGVEEEVTVQKCILLNYFMPDADMCVYQELTKGNPDAFEETRLYRLPNEKWVYCKQGKKIEQCSSFYNLELIRKDGNISYYTRKTPKKMEKIEGTSNLYLANYD